MNIFGLLVPAVALAQSPGAPRTSAEWQRLPAYPIPITNNAVASLCTHEGCTIYSFMGMTDPKSPASITAKSFRLREGAGEKWQRIKPAPLLDGRAKIAASAIACGGNVYLIGGYAVHLGEEVTEKRFFRYDATADEYVELAPVPIEVDDTVAACHQEKRIYLISGWHGPKHKNTSAVQVYDIAEKEWKQATPIPAEGRFGHVGGIAGDRLLTIDGCLDSKGFPLKSGTFVGTISPGDPTKVVWQRVGRDDAPPLYRAAGGSDPSLDGWILVAGGTVNPYNYSGTGYDGLPSAPSASAYAVRAKDGVFLDVRATREKKIPETMDHRGLVRFGDLWVTVGGMTGPGKATRVVKGLRLREFPSH